MFRSAPPKASHTASINGRRIDVQSRETLLAAALRQGVPLPFSCRVGGCGTCKCRLVGGEVRELTETGYILSEAELAQGGILACQSVPLGDVAIEVDLAAAPQRRSIAGRVTGQRRLTHDITALEVQLDQGLPYRAGQYAQLSLGALPGVSRNYSFATPTRADACVRFLVRRVPQGRFSTLVNETDLVGETVQIEGPHGDFWLRASDAPLLLVGGGSGLAPLLAMLHDALDTGQDARAATLLFGARAPRDLYALDELDAIARRWRGGLRVVPVLSEAAADASWHGARGLVTEAIAAHLPPGAVAYLCGPPAMVDAAVAALAAQGVARERIHADRFLTAPLDAAAPAAADAAPAARTPTRAPTRSAADAGLLDYLKFFLFHAIGLASAAALFAGGASISAAFVATLLFYIVGDAVCGDDVTTPRFRHPGVLTLQLWAALPLLALIVFAGVWAVSPGDPLGAGAWLGALTGFDLLGAKAATQGVHRVSAVLLTGLMIGMIGTIPAHELTHRTWDRVSLAIGRALLAFSFDTIFSIEHVYGHHRSVACVGDPATAPRGRNAYAHIVISTLRGNLSAWHIEAQRLQRKGLPRLSWHNAVLRGHGLSLLLVALAGALGGWQGAVFFCFSGLWGKALLEIVNYMEHYGMVRAPTTPVQPRHSWNTNRRLSSWSMFNLTRHSHHHAQGEIPYQDLKPFPDAPMMVGGYLTTLVVAMIPPLWHRLMTPRVLDWDRRFASPDERELAAAANRRSGVAALVAASNITIKG
ncbi:MAG: fatty acid desaturase [Pelomonas sp.]|nr:fatty acid desaturase [Roseateles sp.]